MGNKLSIRGIYRSLKKIYQINQGVKEIRKSLREPEMIKNIDNMRLAAETMQNTSKKLESSIQEIKKTGVFEEASKVLKAAHENKNNMSEITSAIKEMQVSIKALRDELRLTANDFKESDLLWSNDTEPGAYPAGHIKDITSKYNTNHRIWPNN
jgi:uncharacterized coiled-coil DUF342 family protein